MFFSDLFKALIFEHAQKPTKTRPGFREHNDIINITPPGNYKQTGKFFLISILPAKGQAKFTSPRKPHRKFRQGYQG